MTVSPRAFISGGGDGALQDFLRLTTRLRTAKEIYLLLHSSVRDELEDETRTTEDNHKRTPIWLDRDSECEIHRSIQRHYEALVDRIYDRSGGRL